MDRVIGFLNNRYLIAVVTLLFILGIARGLRRG